MRFDEIDAIKAQKDPNSCYRPDDDEAAFEVAKEYLERFDVIEEE